MEYGDPDHSVSYKVFHYYFNVRIPASFAYEKSSRMLGSPVYSESGMSEAAASEMVEREHTISEMVEYSERGAPIELVDPSKSVIIYALLKEHLDNMRGSLANTLHNRTVPISDIRSMDSFLEILYPITRQYECQDMTKTKSKQHADRMFNYRRFRKRRDEPEDNTVKTESGKTLREHNPITGDIAKIVADRKLLYK